MENTVTTSHSDCKQMQATQDPPLSKLVALRHITMEVRKKYKTEKAIPVRFVYRTGYSMLTKIQKLYIFVFILCNQKGKIVRRVVGTCQYKLPASELNIEFYTVRPTRG
jgi:hypothetical protein